MFHFFKHKKKEFPIFVISYQSSSGSGNGKANIKMNFIFRSVFFCVLFLKGIETFCALYCVQLTRLSFRKKKGEILCWIVDNLRMKRSEKKRFLIRDFFG